MEVKFEYALDQRVITPFGDEGLVSMVGVDDGGKQYFVKTRNESNWFKESQIKAAE